MFCAHVHSGRALFKFLPHTPDTPLFVKVGRQFLSLKLSINNNSGKEFERLVNDPHPRESAWKMFYKDIFTRVPALASWIMKQGDAGVSQHCIRSIINRLQHFYDYSMEALLPYMLPCSKDLILCNTVEQRFFSECKV